MSRPQRLAMVIHAIRGGGAERVAALLANHWAEQGRHVTLITLEARQPEDDPLASTIERIGLDLLVDSPTPLHAIWFNGRRVRAIRRAVRRTAPEVVVSHCLETNVLALLACRPLSVPVLVTEHTSLLHHRARRAWSWLRKLTYPWAAGLVVLSEAWRQPGQRLVGRRPVWVIPNAVPPPKERPAANGQPADDRRRLISMGRLSPEKGFDLLLEAFARVAPKHADWDLWILGEGAERPRLEQIVDQLGLTARVHMPGWVAEPERYLFGADLYVMPSRYEGSPVALQEAMACGLPAVSFDCPGGAGEVVRHGVDGLLVPPGDVQQLAAALDRLMSSTAERAALAARAAEVRQRFSLERFFQQWDAAVSLDPAP